MSQNPRWIRVLVSGNPSQQLPQHPAGQAAQMFQQWPLMSEVQGQAQQTGNPEELGTGLGPSRATPLVDIHDRTDALILEADLPGVAEEDIVVELKQNVLRLTAKVRRPGLENARPLALESTAGIYERSFILSDEFDSDLIQADFEQGVLRLTIPRSQRVVSRRIEINNRGR
ncbi:MAG: Hsp20/alpha crystallin family protein [bacterium]